MSTCCLEMQSQEKCLEDRKVVASREPKLGVQRWGTTVFPFVVVVINL